MPVQIGVPWKNLAPLIRGVAFIWRATRKYTVAWICILIAIGILPVATIALTKQFIDGLLKASRAGGSWESVQPVLITGGLLAFAGVAQDSLQGLLEWVRTAQSQLVQDYLAGLIQQKSVEVDFSFYESAEYYDRLYRARDNGQARILQLLEHMGVVVQNSITLVLLVSIVATYNAYLLAAMLMSVVPAFYVVARAQWLTHQWWVGTTTQRRWIQYYDQKFSMPTAAAEIRLFRLGPHFQRAYARLRRVLRDTNLTLIKRQNASRLGAGVVGGVVSGLSVAWVGWQTILGKTSLGNLALFYQAFVGGQGFMRAITVSVGHVYSNGLFLRDLCEFLDLEPSVIDPPDPVPVPPLLKTGIHFRGVTFQYPGAERVALQCLDLFIPAGKIVAIVGPNGAGKSTLVKLLSRLYDPLQGVITMDGIPLGQMALDDVRSRLSILFQLPVSYDASASENIAIGDLQSDPSPERIRDAAQRAGADEIISRLPQCYDTPLGKSFENGTDLSAGEWQRIAMARAFLRQAPVILLDEPTSFMDSWAELQWFDRLRSLATGRTAMIVTHRFTIAKRADLIYVMDQGQVVESGTHASLLRADGLYAQSWREQMMAEWKPSGSAGSSAVIEQATST
jgi:ATP-binding cassette subfamily B protein